MARDVPKSLHRSDSWPQTTFSNHAKAGLDKLHTNGQVDGQRATKIRKLDTFRVGLEQRLQKQRRRRSACIDIRYTSENGIGSSKDGDKALVQMSDTHPSLDSRIIQKPQSHCAGPNVWYTTTMAVAMFLYPSHRTNGTATPIPPHQSPFSSQPSSPWIHQVLEAISFSCSRTPVIPRAARSAALRRARHPLLEPPEVIVDVTPRHRRRLLGVHAGPELLLDDGAAGRVVARGCPARCIPSTVSHLFTPATSESHFLVESVTHLIGSPSPSRRGSRPWGSGP